MACYIVPVVAALLVFFAKKISCKGMETLRFLDLVFGGGAVMLIIDHLWNGELFLVGENIASDLLLGVAMTAGAIAFWFIAVKTKVPDYQPIESRA